MESFQLLIYISQTSRARTQNFVLVYSDGGASRNLADDRLDVGNEESGSLVKQLLLQGPSAYHCQERLFTRPSAPYKLECLKKNATTAGSLIRSRLKLERVIEPCYRHIEV